MKTAPEPFHFYKSSAALVSTEYST